jgi:tyrosyl-tRNA synthetase
MSNQKLLSQEFQWRNMVKDKTFDKFEYLDQPHKIYYGIDGTADSLTIGHLVGLVALLRFAQFGSQVFVVIGGGTTLVGDPSGKNKERPILSIDEINQNVDKIQSQIQNIFRHNDFQLLNNYHWLKDLKFLDFLRDFGKYINVNELLDREFIAQRLSDNSEGISFAEFSYANIQAYDYFWLNQKYQIDLQIGGSDQWGNILSGVNLIKRIKSKTVQAMTLPLLINQKTGVKFGKSEAGAVWLDETKTSVLDFYQFFINVVDEQIDQLLKFYTFYSDDEIKEIIKQHLKDPSKRYGQQILAESVTKLIHGSQKTEAVILVSDILTGKKLLKNLTQPELNLLKKEIKTFNFRQGLSVFDVLIDSGLIKSKTEGKKLLQAGAISLNFEVVKDDILQSNQAINHVMIIRKGKAFKDSVVVIVD